MKAEVLIPMVESMELVGYAVPTPNQIEFTVADPTCDLPRFPKEVKDDVVNALRHDAILFRMVATELGTHGNGIAVAILVPQEGQTIVASKDCD